MEIRGTKAPGNDFIIINQDKKDFENVEKVNQKNLSDPNAISDPNQSEKNSQQIELFKENLERLKKIFRGEAEFKIDKDTNMVVIKIKDPETGEIIRQIPPELAVKLAKNIQELLGVLIDERV